MVEQPHRFANSGGHGHLSIYPWGFGRCMVVFRYDSDEALVNVDMAFDRATLTKLVKFLQEQLDTAHKEALDKAQRQRLLNDTQTL